MHGQNNVKMMCSSTAMKFRLLLLLAGLNASICNAQLTTTGTIHGTVSDHANFNAPNTAVGAGAFGAITSAKNPRMGEMALKLTF